MTTIEMRPFHVLKQDDEKNETAKPCRTTENIMTKVESFFSKPEHMGKLLPFLHGTSKISLRMVEWFVFVHSMKHTIDWFIGDEYFNVYLDYQSEMVDNKKQRFDPMCRTWRKEKRKQKNGEITTVKVYHGINFYYTEKDYVVTSVAQLNFFRWFIGKGVLDYMLEHYDGLVSEMNTYNGERKRQKKLATGAPTSTTAASPTPKTVEKPAKKTRIQATKMVTKKNVEVYVSFD